MNPSLELGKYEDGKSLLITGVVLELIVANSSLLLLMELFRIVVVDTSANFDYNMSKCFIIYCIYLP